MRPPNDVTRVTGVTGVTGVVAFLLGLALSDMDITLQEVWGPWQGRVKPASRRLSNLRISFWATRQGLSRGQMLNLSDVLGWGPFSVVPPKNIDCCQLGLAVRLDWPLRTEGGREVLCRRRGYKRGKESQWYQPQNVECREGALVITARREKLAPGGA